MAVSTATGILTGRHPERNGLNYQLLPPENIDGVGLPLTEKTLPQYLQPLGYATGAFGKWNIGFGKGARPTETVATLLRTKGIESVGS